MFNCKVCGSAGENHHVIKLTKEERRLLPEAAEEYHYCPSCWRVLSNPVTAPSLISGMALHHLRQAGVANAEQLADQFRQDLTVRATTRRS